ncbi:MAG: hypothetical protein ACTHNW_18020, partial [Mucilaginibacter sp.]
MAKKTTNPEENKTPAKKATTKRATPVVTSNPATAGAAASAKPVKEKAAPAKKTEAAPKTSAKTKKPAAEKTPAKKAAATIVAPDPQTVDMLNVEPYSRFTEFDISLFKSGKHYKLYEKFGAHVVEYRGMVGTY